MTTYYGSKVGTLKQATRPTPIPSVFERGTDHILCRDTIELAAAAGSLVELAVLPWETVISPSSRLWFDDLGSAQTFDIGDVTYPTALVSGTDTGTAASGADGVAFLKSVDIANYFKPLWEMLGYASLAAAKLIGAQCQLLGRVNTNTATGTVTWQISGQARLA
jgi:hypothetical protein